MHAAAVTGLLEGNLLLMCVLSIPVCVQCSCTGQQAWSQSSLGIANYGGG